MAIGSSSDRKLAADTTAFQSINAFSAEPKIIPGPHYLQQKYNPYGTLFLFKLLKTCTNFAITCYDSHLCVQ